MVDSISPLLTQGCDGALGSGTKDNFVTLHMR